MGVETRQLKVGLNLGTSGSWGSGAAPATAVGAGDGIYVIDDLGTQLRVNYALDDSQSQNFIGSVQTSTTQAVNGAVPLYLHYHDTFMNVLWAWCFGTGGTAPTQVGTTTAYTNTFEPATNKTGRYATIVRDKVQQIHETPGAKCTGFDLSFGENGRAEVRFNFIGDTVKIDSTINTATQVSALTFPTLGLRAFFDDVVVRVNAQSGAALQASDAIKVTSLRVRFAQPMDTKYVGGQVTIIEPEETGPPAIDLELEFARYDATSDDYFAYHRDATALKADLTFTGPTLATTNYGLLFQFPNVVVPEQDTPTPGGQIAPRIRLLALSTTTAPTGMTGVTKPIRLVTTGVSTTNPFA